MLIEFDYEGRLTPALPMIEPLQAGYFGWSGFGLLLGGGGAGHLHSRDGVAVVVQVVVG